MYYLRTFSQGLSFILLIYYFFKKVIKSFFYLCLVQGNFYAYLYYPNNGVEVTPEKKTPWLLLPSWKKQHCCDCDITFTLGKHFLYGPLLPTVCYIPAPLWCVHWSWLWPPHGPETDWWRWLALGPRCSRHHLEQPGPIQGSWCGE